MPAGGFYTHVTAGEPAEREMKYSKPSLAGALVIALAFGAASAASAALDYAGSFKADTPADGQLDLATYKKGDGMSALVGIAKPGHKVSFAFSPEEWPPFLEQCRKLKDVQAAAPNWIEAVTLSETHTTSPSHLLIYVGASIQIVITDPTAGTNTFILPKTSLDAFVEKVEEVGRRLPAPPAPAPGAASGAPAPH